MLTSFLSGRGNEKWREKRAPRLKKAAIVHASPKPGVGDTFKNTQKSEIKRLGTLRSFNESGKLAGAQRDSGPPLDSRK